MAGIGLILKLILTAILLVVFVLGALLLLVSITSLDLASIISLNLTNTSLENASNASLDLASISSQESFYDTVGVVVFSVVFMIIGIAGLYWIYGPQEAEPGDL